MSRFSEEAPDGDVISTGRIYSPHLLRLHPRPYSDCEGERFDKEWKVEGMARSKTNDM